MAEQVDVNVKNVLNSAGDIRVERKLPDDRTDIDVTIGPGDEEKILLPTPDVLPIISPPDGWTIWCNVIEGTDLVVCSGTAPNLTIQMTDNDADSQVPLNVNVEVGGEPPAP